LSDTGADQSTPGRQVLSVRQVNDAISSAIQRAFPQTIWVRGEVQRFPSDAAHRKHLYFELQETSGSGAAEYQVAVAMMGWDRQRYGLGRYVDGSDPDFQLANKLEVCLECQVDYYAKFGKISLKIVGVDKNFAMGKLELRRREILAYLQQENLFGLNAAIPLPDLPLKVGLITSPQSAAHHDFMTGLSASNWAFDVQLRGAKMQGAQLEPEVIAAIKWHMTKGVDVIVLTRGGGSRADLSWFDQRDLAEAIARSGVPVITAIGHEIDKSIADMVAHHSCKTPTAAAEFLVEIVDEAAHRVDQAQTLLLNLVEDKLRDGYQRLDVGSRLAFLVEGKLLKGRLQIQSFAAGLQQRTALRLTADRDHLGRFSSRLQIVSATGLLEGDMALSSFAPRLQLAVSHSVTHEGRLLSFRVEALLSRSASLIKYRSQKLESLAEKARLLDPTRLLARGYSLTSTGDGAIVKSINEVSAGQLISTRFHDGEVTSIVQPRNLKTGKISSKGKKSGSKSKANSGQKTLFR